MKSTKSKIILFAGLLAFGFSASAQTGVFKNLRVDKHFRLNGNTVTSISMDSALANADPAALVTEWAVKNYVDNRAGSYTIATGQTYVVASQAAMLALSAGVGDVAVIPDSAKTYILRVAPPTTLSNWTQVLTPASVQSVNGRTGNVTAQTGDYDITMITGLPRWLTKVYAGYGMLNVNDSTLAMDSTKFATVYANSLKENYLGKPSADGYVLSSNTAGSRSWVAQSAGSGTGTDSMAFRDFISIDSTKGELKRIAGKRDVVVQVVPVPGGSPGSSGITQSQLDDTAHNIRNSFPGIDQVLAKGEISYNNRAIALQDGVGWPNSVSISPFFGLQGSHTDSTSFKINSYDGFYRQKVNSPGTVTIRWGRGWYSSAHYPLEFPSLDHAIAYDSSTYFLLAVNGKYADSSGKVSITQLPINSKPSDPTTLDVASGMSAVYKNTASGNVYLWVNNGGTMLKVQLN